MTNFYHQNKTSTNTKNTSKKIRSQKSPRQPSYAQKSPHHSPNSQKSPILPIIIIATTLVFLIIFIVALVRINTKPAEPVADDPETLAQAEADAAQKEYASRDKIFQITPYKNYNDGFFITATWTDNKPITITVSLLSCVPEYQTSAKQKADEWLKKQGINTSNYKIEYINKC